MLLFWPDALRAKSGQTLVALTTWLVLSFVFLCSVVDCMSVEEILLLQYAAPWTSASSVLTLIAGKNRETSSTMGLIVI